MKNQKKYSRTINSKTWLFILLAVVFSNTAALGQSGKTGTLIQDGVNQEINTFGNFYTDYTIPSPGAYPYLTLTARGADGGKAWIEALEGFKYVVKRTGNGGEGATVTANFKIGTGLGELLPGSKLRTIIGVAGSSGRNCRGCLGQHGGGGGGTGVLYLPQGADETKPANWNILVVAGGGGGGAAGTGGNSWDGIPGQTTEHGFITNLWTDAHSRTIEYDEGETGVESPDLRDYFGYHGAGGILSGNVGGGGGTSYHTWKETAAGESWGNGIYQDETVYGSAEQLMGEPLEWSEYEAHYGQGLFQKVNGYYAPVGGKGGDGGFPGGFGCGGGGGSLRWVGSSGGGGGGFSGGWAGDASNDKDGNPGGGSGGGSFVNEKFAVAGNILMFRHGTTNNAKNGFVNYQFSAQAISSVAYGRSFSTGATLLRSGAYQLSWQGDGNLVLYGPAGAVWASGTNSKGTRLSFQGDGNMVIRDASAKAIWTSDTANGEKPDGKGGRKLILTPQGKLVITNEDHKVIWAKN